MRCIFSASRRLFVAALALGSLGSVVVSADAQAADFRISTGTSTVDCSSRGIRPGDTITLLGTSRGDITFQDCVGSRSNPIVIRNDVTENAPLTLRSSSNAIVNCLTCSFVVIDGTGKWSGAPAGSCGVASWPGIVGTSQCGIVAVQTGGGDMCYRFARMSTNFTLKGTASIGCRISVNDHTINLADNPGFWREDFVITHNYVQDAPGEGMYIGANHRDADIPLRNVEISYNYVNNAAWDGINLKSAWEGSNEIHHNIVIDSGSGTDGATGQHKGLATVDSSVIYYNNYVEGSGEHGIHGRLVEIPSNHGTKTMIAYNNIVVGSGVTGPLDGKGIVFGRGGSQPQVNVAIYNNTVVNNEGSGIDASDASSGVVRDNISVGSGGSAISVNGSVSSINNRTGSVSSVNFVNPNDRDYRLAPSSPAIDAGTMVSTTPADDFEGVPRPQGARPDQGAYEFIVGGSAVVTTIPNPPASFQVL